MSRSSALRCLRCLRGRCLLRLAPALVLVAFAGAATAAPEPAAPWGISLAAGPDRRFGDPLTPIGAGRLYATVAVWRNVDRMRSLGVEGGWLGADDQRVVYVFYRQSGPSLEREEDFRRTRQRWTRLGLQARLRGGDRERGPFATAGAAAYFRHTTVRDEVSVPADPSVPVQRTESDSHGTFAGVNGGGGVLWGGGALLGGVFVRVDWAFARDRFWLGGGVTLDFH